MRLKRLTALLVAASMCVGLTACSGSKKNSSTSSETKKSSESVLKETTESEREKIEKTLDLSQNKDVKWSYDSKSDSWTMSVTSAVTNPELEDYQGVSVNVPGAYIKGIDTDGNKEADVTSKSYSDAVNGKLVIDENAEIKNENGQIYTAKTAPVVINTGAAGYSEQKNQQASSQNAAYGYINVACGNRGKQSTAEDENGKTYYTGDAPLCLVDQKNAIRYVKYNIILGNLPGNTEYFVSTGGSGGGAHASMVAATSDNSDYYAYEVEAGAVGIYRNEDGTYSETLQSEKGEISDGVWGCIAYSAITSLQEADMAMAFEYYLDKDYDFNTDFQKQMAKYLSQEYMEYINSKKLEVEESKVGFDLNGDGDKNDKVALTIEYDKKKYADTNGYGGTYLTLYLKQFEQNLKWYLENLDYADGWTWFDSNGKALSDKSVAKLTTEDKAKAFIEGRYAKSETKHTGFNGALGGKIHDGKRPDKNMADGEMPDGDMKRGKRPDGNLPDNKKDSDNSTVTSGMGDEVGTPDEGTTQASGSKTDSSNYSSYDEMLSSYKEDIASIQKGDKHGNNIVDLYDPLNYIDNKDTKSPVWTRIVMGAAEGDMSLFASMNMQIAWLNSGTDAKLEWQWDGGHVPSEIFGESLALYIDEMYGTYVDGAIKITKSKAKKQTTNGDASKATGTDISSQVSYKNGEVKFSLADAASYRTNGANKAIPGFDVMDYGQETYEFGSSEKDARHFDKYVLKVLQENKEELSKIFNNSK